MNPLNVEVSLFDDVTDKMPLGSVVLYEVIKNPPADLIAKVNAVRNEPDPKQQKKLKSEVGGITPSGTFKTRNAQGLIKHSGLIALDLDADKNPGLDFIDFKKNIVPSLPWVTACLFSVRGQGLVIYVPISNAELHAEHFDSLFDEFTGIGVKIDPACRDVCRFRFHTFDPAPYLNTEALKYTGLKKQRVTQVVRPACHGTGYSPGDDLFKWARKQIEGPKGVGAPVQFTDGQKHSYLFRLCSILNIYGMPQSEAEARIDAELFPVASITTNCISGPYSRYASEFGSKTFKRSGLHFPKRTQTKTTPATHTPNTLPDLDWLNTPAPEDTLPPGDVKFDMTNIRDLPPDPVPPVIIPPPEDVTQYAPAMFFDSRRDTVPDWGQRVEALRKFFEVNRIEDGLGLMLSLSETITDVSKFIDANMNLINNCPPIKTYEPYLLKTEQVARVIHRVNL